MPTSLRTSLAITTLALLMSACGGSSEPPVFVPPPVVFPSPSPATLAQIDEYVQAQMRSQHIPGMSVIVTRDGKPILQKGYGSANLASGAAVTHDTVFRIGSVSKQFTASAIMLLVQDGKLTLDQPLSHFFPTAPASWKGITVRHLLSHTSGLQRDFPESLLEQVDPNHLPPIDQLIVLAGEMPLDAAPGATHAYSNVGYHLLGFVIEKVTGQYYADFLQQRIFRPLGMASADVIRTVRQVPAMAVGYTWDGTAIKPAGTFTLTPGLVEAEGGLQMSAADLAKWDAALTGAKILSKESMAQMWAPTRLTDGSTVRYGFGWALDEINAQPFVRHDGLIEGFTSQYARHGNEGLAVIVLANTDSAFTERVVTRIGGLLDSRLNWFTSTDPQPQTATLLKTLMDESARGVLQADQRFAPALRRMLSEEVLQSFTAYLKAWGTVEQPGYIDKISVNGMQVTRYLVRSGQEQAVIGIALDAQGQVSYLGLLGE